MGSACLIRTEDLCFERDEIKVIDRVNLKLNSGDLLQVEGSNGSGKTTLLRLLTTAIKPTSGRIFYQGKNYQIVDTNIVQILYLLGIKSP